MSLSVDAIDMSGKHEVDLDTNICKETVFNTLCLDALIKFRASGFLELRLNSNGLIIGTEYLSDLVEKEHADHKHDHDKEKDHLHIQGFDQAAENLVKRVKQALADGEG